MVEIGLELARENFVRKDWSSLPGAEHQAMRYDGFAPICVADAWVYWQSDESDKLIAIRGTYQMTCL